MQVQTLNDQYLIQIEQSAVSMPELQRMLDYLRVKSIVTRSQATQTDIDQLADEMTQTGWDGLQADLLRRIKS
jgi:hypothetical protein